MSAPSPEPHSDDRWSALYAAWLRVIADWNDPAITTGDKDDEANRRCEQEEQLARTVMTTPASQPWMVQRKFEMFERYLDGSDDWADKRLTLMLAAIRADLMRFGIGRDAQGSQG